MFNNMTITRAIKSRFDAFLSIYTKGKQMNLLHVQKSIQLLFLCTMITIQLFINRLKQEGEYILN
jgi:hypothetical protein